MPSSAPRVPVWVESVLFHVSLSCDSSAVYHFLGHRAGGRTRREGSGRGGREMGCEHSTKEQNLSGARKPQTDVLYL